MSAWLHLAINVLGTILLGASNYCMQCLSFPTRDEVNKAHSRGAWLDIGVPSVRNLRQISSKRLALWWLLAVSSIPLHFLYNSPVFTTLAAQSYGVFVAPSTIREGPWQRWNSDHPSPATGFLNISAFETLDHAECIRAYSKPYMSDRSNVAIIVTSTNEDIETITYNNYELCQESLVPYCWICSDTGYRSSCDVGTITSTANKWNVSYTITSTANKMDRRLQLL